MKNNFNNNVNPSRLNHHVPVDIDKIFGFRAHDCEKCLTTEALEVYYVDNQKKKVTRKEKRHVCNSQWAK